MILNVVKFYDGIKKGKLAGLACRKCGQSTIEQHILNTNAWKQLSQAATDV